MRVSDRLSASDLAEQYRRDAERASCPLFAFEPWHQAKPALLLAISETEMRLRLRADARELLIANRLRAEFMRRDRERFRAS